MLVPLHFPISILPRVITELWSIFQHLLSDVRAEATERRVVLKRTPRDRIMAVIKAHEATEAHYGVTNTTRHLVDDQMIDLTDLLAIGTVDLRAVKVFA